MSAGVCELEAACIMPKQRSRATLHSGRRLDINELRRSGVRTGEFEVTFSQDGAPATLNVHMGDRAHNWLRVRLPPQLDQTIGLVAVRRPFGGCQWYFICSLSGHRASVLWKPRGANLFACHKYWRRRLPTRLSSCLQLTGPSQHPPH